MDLNANATVTFNDNGSSGIYIGDPLNYELMPDKTGFYDWYYPVYYYWNLPCTLAEKNKIEQSFKIVQKLMEKKVIDKMTLKKFITLVNEIANIL